MRFLVMSDTHGQTELAEQVIREYRQQIDGVWHLGDLATDAEKLQRVFREDPALAFAYVPGNCDGYGRFPERRRVFPLEGRRVLLTHGDEEHVTFGTQALIYRAREVKADVVCYGHTHVPLIQEENGIYILNPGSLTLPRGGSKRGFALLEITGGKVAGTLISC